MYHLASHRLAEARFRGYELSNWARPGHESRHNLAYWERRPVRGGGTGRPRLRRGVPTLERSPARRLRRGAPAGRIGDAPTPAARWRRARLEPATAAAEAIILGLRTGHRGADDRRSVEPPFDETSPGADAAGLLEQTSDGRVRLTTNGRLLSNELFARLI